MPKLTARKIENLKERGMYGDGEGLYLRVGPTGAKSWILRTRIQGRFTDMGRPLRWEGGLGSFDVVTLAEARDKARALRKVAKEGGDPALIKKRQAMTFENAARTVFDGLSPTWKNPRHAKIWWASLENHALPQLGNRYIDTIGAADVLAVLSPIWTEKHDTALRVRQRIASVFDWAKAAGYYPRENPLNGLSKALPPMKRKRSHMAALDWREVPAFMAELAKREGVSARTLEFLILTATRSGEARGARWSEIKGSVWTIPAERMKRGIEHRIPLSEAALGVLERVEGLSDDLVFPSIQIGEGGKVKQQSVMVFKSLLLRMKRDGFTVHGFRSSFRDWASESARADREVAEAALSHATGNEVERAYARSDLFERRIALMDSWARHCVGDSGTVVRMIS
jgi:integrase